MKRRKVQEPTLRERCRAIFQDEPPVQYVWEPEFDYDTESLRKLAKTPWQQITGHQLSCYYVLNLAYHEPMQPELFRYLFPLCLAEWHEALMYDVYGDYFEESLLKALRRPYLWQEMMDSQQRQNVCHFLIETMLAQMDNGRSFDRHPCGWLSTFNGLGGAATVIRAIWTQWWALETPGRAICALQYAAYLIYPKGDNPLWPDEPCLWYHPLSDEHAWMEENRAFLRGVLATDTLLAGVQAAAERLRGEPEGAMAARIASDALNAHDIITIQIEDLLLDLSRDESGHALE